LARTGFLRRFTGPGRTGSTVLVGALLAGVLAASFGVGYSATTPELDNATNDVAHGNGVSQVNSETQRVENEARALATGDQEIEVVVLQDGRPAAVNTKTGEVHLYPADLGSDSTVTPPQADKSVPGGEQPAVIAGKDSGYVVDPAGNTVRQIGVDGPAPAPVPVPGGASRTAVPDGAGGIWVLTDDEKAVHIVRDRVVGTASAPGPIRHLSVADGRPVGITESGEALDIAASPPRTIASRPVPSGPSVVVGSPRGAGRYLLVLDRKDGRLFAVDPRTRNVHEIGGLPTGSPHNLGAPVILDDRAYIPDYGTGLHLLYVRDLPSGTPRDDVPVPGEYERFSLEVRDHRVWANDQFDRRVVVVDRGGRPAVIDKGPGPGVRTDTTAGKDKNQTPPKDAPPSTVPPPPTTAPEPTSQTPKTPPPLVTVPTIPPGTQQLAACDRIRAVKLRCDIVETGADCPTGTVRGTDPPGGSRVPEGSTVRLLVCGRVPVPDVFGQLSGAACAKIENGAREPGAGGQLKCAKEPMPNPGSTWSDLDVVAEQNPKAGTRVELDTTVTVRFWNTVPMEDLSGRNGANECSRIVTSSRNKVTCTVQSAGEAPTPDKTGLVASQLPAPGSPVGIGGAITLSAYGPPVPRVPPVSGEINAACQAVRNAGYTCDPRPDVLARNANVVASQEPPAGTQQQGGTVVLHYAPYEPQPVYLWVPALNNDPVYVLRVGDAPTNEYYRRLPNPIGYAYPAAWSQPGTGNAVINDFYCTAGPAKCGGFERNHYMSRDTSPRANFSGPTPAARFIDAPQGPCASGQIPMYRFFRHPSGNLHYAVGSSPPWTPDFQEWLGCIWAP
jgi:beta-lactam-binding protein with PASTA domain